MATVITKTRDYTVVKANQLIEASYALTLAEQRLLLACISQIDSTKALERGNVFHLNAKDIGDLFSVDSKNAYETLKQGVEALYLRTIKVEGRRLEFRWIYLKDYHNNEGRITIEFTPEVVPYLTLLTERFTAYKLKYIAKFKSNYSIRLYELLVQWVSVGEREIDIDQLRQIFRLENKYRSVYEIKRWVIIPALNDINTHSNLWVKFGQRKRGRIITHFHFQFGLKESEKSPQKHITEHEISSNARPGETRAQVIARLN